MLDILWGIKTIAAFDVWTFEHILSGVSVGALMTKLLEKPLKKINPKLKTTHSTFFKMEILGVLFIAYMWEALEHYLETGLAGGAVAHWFQGVEFPMNRLITDPLMVVLGYFIVKRWPHFVMPARLFSVAWLILHIFIFPHSMWLHYMFGS